MRGLLESPPNGSDIFDVFWLPRHLNNFSTKKALFDFYGDSKSVNKIKSGN
jgi:hypothetical protein